jgi:predicted dehydrogenase
MTAEYGHTSFDAAFVRGDVYGVQPDPRRAGKRPLTLALAGCGGVAQAKWLPAIRRLQTIGEPIELFGVADPDETARAKVSSLWSTRDFATLGALLEAGRPNLVLVTAADDAHGQLARDAIRAGVPCLVEKPLTRDLSEARELCRLADEAGVLLAGVANKRFSPPYALAKDIVQAGGLKGTPRLFQGKFTLGYPYVDILESGTVHMLDLALWFMGPAARVHAVATFAGTAASRKLENAVLALTFVSGAIGSVTTSASALSFKPWERVEVFGQSAMLTVDDQLELTLYDDETGPAKSWKPAVPNTLMFDESFGGYTGLLEHVLDAVRGDATLNSTGWNAAAAVELIEATKLSIETGSSVDLPLNRTRRRARSEDAL